MIAPLAISLGDPAGIGPEITAKAWAARTLHALPPFFAVGDIRSLAAVSNVPLIRIDSPEQAVDAFGDGLPVVSVPDSADITPGTPDSDGARCALDSLELAVGLARSGAAGALVTGPVSKSQLYAIGFRHPGQTEFVAERCGVASENAVMMLAGPTLRVVPITTHVALSAVSSLLSVELVAARARATARGLTRNFGIEHPRLALAGFNPHAGEAGAMGCEEIDILEPAVAILRDEGIDIIGPLPADTMFHPRARARFDAALCCYHDQALVPLKTLHFDEGVNITLGLPIVRTSPDHGTAFPIAGRNAAEAGAMIAAVRMAASAAERRARSSQ
ncbi:4-hydroxythreonine-4-phosphate dehydrogenase PdxA [Sphingomonas sp.]